MAVQQTQVMDLATHSRIMKCSTLEELLSVMQQHDVTVHAVREDGFSLLHTFAIVGSYAICKYLCSNGARPTLFFTDNSTVFHSAMKARSADEDEERANILKLFLDKDDTDIELNERNTAGWTAIKLAARRSLEKCVEVLLSHGADPNIPDNEKFTPLHNAVTSVDILKLLLSKACDVNPQNNKGETPLYTAVEKNSVECAMSLLEHNADPNIGDIEGVAPLFLATKNGNFKLTELLVKAGAKVNACGTKQGITPLHWAAHKENDQVALFLIQNGANILLADNEGRTPVSMASPALAEQMIASAKSHNPEIDVTSSNVEAKLSAADKAVAACCGGNVQALSVLFEAGISVNHITGETQSTLLHMAAYCGQLQVVAYLLSLEGNVVAVDKDKDTVLHFACMKEVSHGLHDRTLQLLLNTPAKNLINKRNSKGDTPIMVATRCGFPGRVKLLLKHKADVTIANKKKELPLHRACSTNIIESVMILAERSRNIDVQDEDGWTPLMFAAKSGSAPIVQYLLQRGAVPDLRQSGGFTALYLAAQESHVSACWYLLEQKADPNIVGGPQDLAPLHIAAHHNAIETCKLLMDYGADPCLKDGDGDTPLDLVTSPELKTFMQHFHEKMSNKNRGQGNLPGHQSSQSNDTDSTHVISNDETIFDNEAVGTISNSSDVAVGNNEAVDDNFVEVIYDSSTISNSSDVAVGNNEPVDDNFEVIYDSSTIRNVVAISDSVVTNDNWVTKEHEYCATISELKRAVEVLRDEQKEVHRDLEELESKYKLLEEGKVEEVSSLCSERDQYKLERDELQKKINVMSSSSDNQQTSLPSGVITWQHINHKDVTFERRTGDSVIPNLVTSSGLYRRMEVTIATIEFKRACAPVIMSELYQLSAVRSSHLVQLLATAVDHEHHDLYLVYENIGACTLSNLIQNQTVNWKNKMQLLWDVAVGMDHLHSMDPFIGHFCLCPSVVQVYDMSSSWRAKVGYYGMLQALGSQTIPTSMRIVPYLAPEVLQDSLHVKGSDVYSFGMLMYETVTGYVPYSDTGGSNVIALMNKIVNGAKLAFPRLDKHPGCEEDDVRQVTSIIIHCHSNKQDERPTFADVVSSLKPLLF